MVSAWQSVPVLPRLVTQAQQFAAAKVHPALGDALPFTALVVVVVVVLRALLASLCKRRRTPPKAFPESNTFVRDTTAPSDADAAPAYDVCIVGAGVVGASLATVLGRRGVRVAVVERDLTEPDRIVGELLQPSGVEKLKALGLYDAITGIDAQSVPGYGVVFARQPGAVNADGSPRQEVIELPYPNRPGGSNRTATGGSYAEEGYAERFTGRGLHNGRFLLGLRRLATTTTDGNVKLIQGNVTSLMQRADGTITGVQYRPTVAGQYNANPYPHLKNQPNGHAQAHANGSANGNANGNGAGDAKAAGGSGSGEGVRRVRASLTIVADGCLSVFRRPIFEPQIRCPSKFLGLVLHNCTLPVGSCGNVILANPSPVLVYPISSTETRMLIDFPIADMPRDDEALMRRFAEVVGPQLPASVQGPFREAVASRRWQTMPNQSLFVEQPNVPIGSMVLGDCFNMRHPLTGGGMTVGLTDVEFLVQCFQPLFKPTASGTASTAAAGDDSSRRDSHSPWRDLRVVDGCVSAFYGGRAGRSSVINILADALYAVFLEANPDLREACYDYLGNGPLTYAGPISLLSGLSRSQVKLVFHFYLVALYAVGRLVIRLQFSRALALFRCACRIILPGIVRENNTAPVRALYKVAQWLFWL